MHKSTRHGAKIKAMQVKQLLEAMAMMPDGNINPEIQASQVDLQPADGFVNPYAPMGSMPPTGYSLGNMSSGGFINGSLYNPEA